MHIYAYYIMLAQLASIILYQKRLINTDPSTILLKWQKRAADGEGK